VYGFFFFFGRFLPLFIFADFFSGSNSIGKSIEGSHNSGTVVPETESSGPSSGGDVGPQLPTALGQNIAREKDEGVKTEPNAKRAIFSRINVRDITAALPKLKISKNRFHSRNAKLESKAMNSNSDIASSRASTTLGGDGPADHGRQSADYRIAVGRVKFSESEKRTKIDMDVNDAPESSGSATSTLTAAQRLELRTKLAQEEVTIWQKVKWADHGKQEFEDGVDMLVTRINDFRLKLPELDLEDPLQLIRGGADRPEIWQNAESIRLAFAGLHNALRNANKPFNGFYLTFAVRLEDNYKDDMLWMDRNGYLDGLNLRDNPAFFNVVASSTAPDPGQILENGNAHHEIFHEYLISSTVTRGRDQQWYEVPNLGEELQKIREPGDDHNVDLDYRDIGNVSLDEHRIFNFRRLFQPLVNDNTLGSIIASPEFGRKDRIAVAAKIALAHIHFAAVTNTTTYRQPSNYLFFRESESSQETKPGLWLEHGLGVPPGRKLGQRVMSRADVIAKKISPAADLGLLLYQISRAKEFPYTSIANLTDTRRQVVGELDSIRDKWGLLMKDIVKVCFLTNLPANQSGQDPEFRIIEEVCYALQRLLLKIERGTINPEEPG
jgi:hypothetical protein